MKLSIMAFLNCYVHSFAFISNKELIQKCSRLVYPTLSKQNTYFRNVSFHWSDSDKEDSSVSIFLCRITLKICLNLVGLTSIPSPINIFFAISNLELMQELEIEDLVFALIKRM